MMFTSSETSGGSSRRAACGRITNRCRPSQPKPSAAAASCCSFGIEPTAPRVASATCALPQSVSPIDGGRERVELEPRADRRQREVDDEDRDEDRQAAPELDVEADRRPHEPEVERQERPEDDSDQRAADERSPSRSGAFRAGRSRTCSAQRARPSWASVPLRCGRVLARQAADAEDAASRCAAGGIAGRHYLASGSASRDSSRRIRPDIVHTIAR